MTRTKPRGVRATNAALRRLVKLRTRVGTGMCKRECREAYLVPSDGSEDADEAWTRTKHRFFRYWVWGAFAWFEIGDHGHVAICGLVKGVIFTTDNPDLGVWNRTTLEDFYAKWPGARLRGFSLDIDGVQVRKMPRRPRRWAA